MEAKSHLLNISVQCSTIAEIPSGREDLLGASQARSGGADLCVQEVS